MAAAFMAAALSALPATAGATGFPLVGWWPMNEGSGQVVHDCSGHGNNGTLGNSRRRRRPRPVLDPRRLRRLGAALRRQRLRPDPGLVTSLEPAKLTVAAWIRGSELARQVQLRGRQGRERLRQRLVRPLHLRQRRAGLLHRRRHADLSCARPRRPPRCGTASGTTPRARSTARPCGSSSTAVEIGSACRPRARRSLQPARRRRPHRRLPRTVRPVLRRRRRRRADLVPGAARGDIWRFLKALFSTSR